MCFECSKECPRVYTVNQPNGHISSLGGKSTSSILTMGYRSICDKYHYHMTSRLGVK